MSTCLGKNCSHESHITTNAAPAKPVEVNVDTASTIERNQKLLDAKIEELHYLYTKVWNRKQRRDFDRENRRFKKRKLMKGII